MKKLLSLMAISPMVITACGGSEVSDSINSKESIALQIEMLEAIQVQEVSDFVPQNHIDLANGVDIDEASTSSTADTLTMEEFTILASFAPQYIDSISTIDNNGDFEDEVEIVLAILKAGVGNKANVYSWIDEDGKLIKSTEDNDGNFDSVEETTIEVTKISDGFNFVHKVHKISTDGENWNNVSDLSMDTTFSIQKIEDKYVYGALLSEENTSIPGLTKSNRKMKYGSNDSIIWANSEYSVSNINNKNLETSYDDIELYKVDGDTHFSLNAVNIQSKDEVYMQGKYSLGYFPDHITVDDPEWSDEYKYMSQYFEDLSYEEKVNSRFASEKAYSYREDSTQHDYVIDGDKIRGVTSTEHSGYTDSDTLNDYEFAKGDSDWTISETYEEYEFDISKLIQINKLEIEEDNGIKYYDMVDILKDIGFEDIHVMREDYTHSYHGSTLVPFISTGNDAWYNHSAVWLKSTTFYDREYWSKMEDLDDLIRTLASGWYTDDSIYVTPEF